MIYYARRKALNDQQTRSRLRSLAHKQ